MINLTPTVRTLLILNIIAFIGCQMDWEYAKDNFALWDFKAELFQPYQLLTSMFMHRTFMHIFGNMMGLLFFGSILEQVLGQNRFLLLYLVCGLFAGVSASIYYYYQPIITYATGASGAVLGIAASFALIFPNMPLQMLFPPIRLKAKYMVLLYVVFDLGLMIQNSPLDNIGHVAHLAGMLFGFIMIKLIWRIPKRY
jgi:membrane associated rhomboid family serine protease